MLKQGDICISKCDIALWWCWDSRLREDSTRIATLPKDVVCLVVDGPKEYCTYKGILVLAPSGAAGWTYELNLVPLC